MGRDAEIADELYALAPDEFTAARDKAAKQARDDGDRDLAETIKQFRRPSIGAWLVNQVVRADDDQLDELLDLGAALREAQNALDGAELRAMSKQRHQVIRSLSTLAHTVTGKKVNDAAQREFEATLDAALSDEAAAEAVRSGRLMRALTSTGLEPVDLTDAVAAPGDTPKRAPRRPVTRPTERAKAESKKDAKAAQQAARETKKAEQALDKAQRVLDTSTAQAEQARDNAAAAKQRAAELEAELDDAREAQRRAEAERRSADADLKTATRARDAAQRALDTARKRS